MHGRMSLGINNCDLFCKCPFEINMNSILIFLHSIHIHGLILHDSSVDIIVKRMFVTIFQQLNVD